MVRNLKSFLKKKPKNDVKPFSNTSVKVLEDKADFYEVLKEK